MMWHEMQTEVQDASVAETVEVVNSAGEGRFVLVCEHACNYIPPEMDGLGLDESALQSHIAWDPGALSLAREMSRLLDSPLVSQNVSRLVYDCNRAPMSASAILATSEIYQIPGNAVLSPSERAFREKMYYDPFRTALSGVLDLRLADSPAILTVHSFSPVYAGVQRELDIGLIDDGDDRLSCAMFSAICSKADFDVRRNEPYRREDGVTHTLAEHAVPNGLLNVMIEVRSDLITASSSPLAMAELLAECAQIALASAEEAK